MKTKLLYLFSMLCMLGVFASCSDDDNKVQPIGETYDGVYKGTLDIDLGGTQVGKDIPQKVYFTKVGDTQLKMELKNFSFGTLALGTITVDKCDVTQNDGTTCAFTGEQKLTVPEIGECNVKLEGSIVGSKIDLDIEVAATQGGAAIKVDVDFEGTKLTADQSSEAKITAFTFDSDKVITQPVIDGTNITFVVSDLITKEELAALVPTITVSEKATISPASGVAQDFTKQVTYKVTSEDGIYVSSYTVAAISGKYDFETWVKGEADVEPDQMYYEVAGGWSSSNTGAFFLKLMNKIDKYVVTQTEDAHSGKSAARIETVDSGGENMGFAIIPKVTTGTLFQGLFKTVLSNTLESTKFGIPYSKKPLKLKGFYKYAPGKVFYRCESPATCDVAVEDPNTVDECSINAVMYEVSGFTNENEYLTGVDVNVNSDKIVARAQLKDGSAKANWTEFEIPFTYTKDFDPAKLYRFAIICTSSKDGDKFNGAPGSTLIVDDFELIFE